MRRKRNCCTIDQPVTVNIITFPVNIITFPVLCTEKIGFIYEMNNKNKQGPVCDCYSAGVETSSQGIIALVEVIYEKVSRNCSMYRPFYSRAANFQRLAEFFVDVRY